MANINDPVEWRDDWGRVALVTDINDIIIIDLLYCGNAILPSIVAVIFQMIFMTNVGSMTFSVLMTDLIIDIVFNTWRGVMTMKSGSGQIYVCIR